MDLPGFGDAPRPCHRYAIEDYVAAIAEAQRWVAEAAGQAPVLCALSLSAEFAARAVLWGAPKPPAVLWISPTGLDSRACSGASPWRHRSSRSPIGEASGSTAGSTGARSGAGAQACYVAPSVIRYFLRRTFGRSEINEGLWRAACESLRREERSTPPSILERSTVFPGRRGALSGAHRSADDHPWMPGGFSGLSRGLGPGR